MRRALCITPFSPLPTTEGHRKRIFSTIGMLKRLGFTIDLLLLCRDYLWHRTAGEPQFAALRELADSFHVVPGDYLARDDNNDWQLDDWMSPSFQAYVKWLATGRNYDVVFCNYVFFSQALTYFPKSVCRVLDTHDKFGGRREMLLQNRARVEFFYTSELEEGIGLERSDLVIAIKQQEEDYFRQIAATPVLTLPYVEVRARRMSSARQRSRSRRSSSNTSVRRSKESDPVFGYFASSNWINRENFYKFIKCYKSSDRFLSGDRFNLEVFGSLCNVIEQNADAYVSRGPVREVEEVYNNVDCVMIPQEFSTGMKVKISEALSFEVPIIAHAHALEGFPVKPDALMSCRSFEELVERCFAVKAEPRLLKALHKESLTVQEILLTEAVTAEEAVGRFIAERLPTICIVVSGRSLAKDQIYFEAVQCAASALSSVSRISLCVYGDMPMAIHDYESKGGRHINEFWTASASTDLEKWIEGRRDWLMFILAADAELSERIELDGFGWPSRILFFRDFCDYAAMFTTGNESPLPLNCIDVSGRPSEEAGKVSIWHLRWLPWSLSFAGGLSHHVVSERGFLLTHSRATSNPQLRECLDIVSLEPLDEGAMSLPEFVRMLLTARVRPRFVIDETDFAPRYRLILEMLYLNGIPILSTSEDDRNFLYDGGMADWRVSSVIARGSEEVVPKGAPGWHQSGWNALRQMIISVGNSP